MNNVMTNGFCELNETEMMMVDGGVNGWAIAGGILVGAAVIAGVIAVAPVVTTVGMGVGCVLAGGAAVSSGLITAGIVS